MKDSMELMRERHSVRQYLDKRIPAEIRAQLDAYAAELNAEGNLHMQLIYDEPECFNSRMAHYGRFENCSNYIAMIGSTAPDLEERCGWYGEKLVLKAQELGLNTCWTGVFSRKNITAEVSEGERLVISIAIGYGREQGKPHKSKSAAQVSEVSGERPDWFDKGVEMALLAPTAVNQQKFVIKLGENESVDFIDKGGILSQVDLGIVRCHFEIGSGRDQNPRGKASA